MRVSFGTYRTALSSGDRLLHLTEGESLDIPLHILFFPLAFHPLPPTLPTKQRRPSELPNRLEFT